VSRTLGPLAGHAAKPRQRMVRKDRIVRTGRPVSCASWVRQVMFAIDPTQERSGSQERGQITSRTLQPERDKLFCAMPSNCRRNSK
jgi:hypothetical protein